MTRTRTALGSRATLKRPSTFVMVRAVVPPETSSTATTAPPIGALVDPSRTMPCSWAWSAAGSRTSKQDNRVNTRPPTWRSWLQLMETAPLSERAADYDSVKSGVAASLQLLGKQLNGLNGH